MLHKEENVVPIPGTKRLDYLEENIGATNITLSAAEIARIEEGVDKPSGARYSEAMMRLINNT
jgi:aryl-alcohol dehydrogenase-like predicted oxidoreductase